MKRGLSAWARFAALCVAWMTALSAAAADSPPLLPTQTVTVDRFGDVALYMPTGEPREVVLFLSGDGGWNLGVLDMAQRLLDKGAMVAGIDIRHYMAQLEAQSESCVSPPDDLENLSRYLQAKVGITHYLQPMLAGYSSGATLIYATLAAAPEELFKGGLSLGFCPDLDLKKPLCKGSGVEFSSRRTSKGVLKGVNFLPAKKLNGRWITLQGGVDQVCPAKATQSFIAKVPGAQLVMLPAVGHGYSVKKNWVDQFDRAFDDIATGAASADEAMLSSGVADLPLTEVKSIGTAYPRWFAVFLSGDGGWVGLDRGVAGELAKRGIPVVGWDSLKYFWSPRTPQSAAQDLERVLRHYSQRWGKSQALLIGYSQGADTLPFMVNRLSATTRDMVGFTTLLALSEPAYFEFHVSHWLGNPEGGLPILPELATWSTRPYVCLYGAKESDSLCPQLSDGGHALQMPGGHHFGGGYSQIADQVLRRLPTDGAGVETGR